MTEKQEKILFSALQLFAENGYDATSTSKVAKKAEVSEGLIFRHYHNKEGLLKALMELGRAKAEETYCEILKPEQPEETLRNILSMPFQLKEDQVHFWKLLYALKWQTEEYDHSISAPMKKALVEIFTQLNYDHPEDEAEVALLMMDGIATSVLLRKPPHQERILDSILKKYNL